jgi:hypothetical protein
MTGLREALPFAVTCVPASLRGFSNLDLEAYPRAARG